MTIFYLPLEPYQERYTAQLLGWTIDAFDRRKLSYRVIIPDQHGWTRPTTVQTGVALDAHGRTRWGLRQMDELVDFLRVGEIKHDDVIYTQDLYQPGFDAALYVIEQQFGCLRCGPRIVTHNLAQTIDPDDFTHSWRWMRSYEHLVDWAVSESRGTVLYASSEHEQLAGVAGFRAQTRVVGLLHDADAVRNLLGKVPKPLSERTKRIVYTSRFDAEKQPHFFLDIAEQLLKALPDYEIAVLTGSPQLRSSDPSAVERLKRTPYLMIYQGLSKHAYYEVLADSRLQINTARQDWVSNTLLESSALGTPTLAPAYRGFPEALFNNWHMLYVPWSRDEAITKALGLLNDPPDDNVVAAPSLYHSGTLDRVIDILQEAPSP